MAWAQTEKSMQVHFARCVRKIEFFSLCACAGEMKGASPSQIADTADGHRVLAVDFERRGYPAPVKQLSGFAGEVGIEGSAGTNAPVIEFLIDLEHPISSCRCMT